jgi:hypothetical protein
MALPDRITNDQFMAALDALGLADHRDDVHHIEIDAGGEHALTAYFYAHASDGQRYFVAPGVLATGIKRIPIGTEPTTWT